MGRVTLQTIADAVGVSRMTVSNAFSRPDQLSGDLRNRILAAAEKLGYVGPDPSARALARGSTGAVGMLFGLSLRNVLADEVSSGLLGAIADGLVGSGLSLTLLSLEETGDRIPARDVPMDATLVFTSHADEGALGWLRRRGLPLVLIDQEPVPGVASVNVDDRGGARLAAGHLLELGHRRIGIVTIGTPGSRGPQDDGSGGAAESFVAGQRLSGWLEALERAGVAPVVVRQPKIPYRPEADGYAALSLLLDADPGISGVLCYSDRLAHGLLAAAQDRGLAVPGDLSIVGYDDSPLASNMRPALTTVRQDLEEKGHRAAAALVAAVAARSTGTTDADDAAGGEHVVLPVELVVRASTGVPTERTTAPARS